MQYRPPQDVEDAAVGFDPTSDPFTISIISRKVNQLLSQPGFSPSDRQDLSQDLMARVVKSLESFDSQVGHRYPYLITVLQRNALSIIRNRRAEKRHSGSTASLNVDIKVKDVGLTELAQTIGDEEMDRRLGRERSLTEQQLVDLRLDLARVISGLPPQLQDLVERRKTRSISEIARDTGIARTTLTDWMREIRQHFEAAGLAEYFQT